MHIDSPVFNIDVTAPHLIQQLRTGIGTFRMGHEECQQAVFSWPHFQNVVTKIHPLADRIQNQAIGINGFFTAQGIGAAQYCLNPRDQFPGREWLGHVVIGTGIQTLYLVVFFTARCEHDHRNF